MFDCTKSRPGGKRYSTKFHLSTPFLNPWDEFNEQHWRRTLRITWLYPEKMLTKNTSSILFYLRPRIEVASYADILRACNAIFLPQRGKERLCDQPKVRLDRPEGECQLLSLRKQVN